MRETLGNREEILRGLLNKGLTGTALAVVVSEIYKSPDWMEWDPTVLRADLYSRLGTYLDDDSSDRLQAVATLNTTDAFVSSLDAFMPICRALHGQTVSDTSFLPASLESLLSGVSEAGLHTGRVKKVHPDIARYVGVILDRHGLYLPPSILSFADYPPGSGEKSMADRGTQGADTMFWEDQKQMQTVLENQAMEHVRAIFTEVVGLPVEMDEAVLERIRGALEQRPD